LVEIPFGNPFNLHLPEHFLYARICKNGWSKVFIKLHKQYGYVIDQNWSNLCDEYYSEQYILGTYMNHVFLKNLKYKNISNMLGVKHVFE
jgi:hypothetical protein